MIPEHKLKEAERVVRIVMIVILLTAGTSKFSSAGGFHDNHAELFRGDLRIVLPAGLLGIYLRTIPFIEIGLGVGLMFAGTRTAAIYGWFAFITTLLIGHYVLEEWSAVSQMLGYFFLGLAALILPHYGSLFLRPSARQRLE